MTKWSLHTTVEIAGFCEIKTYINFFIIIFDLFEIKLPFVWYAGQQYSSENKYEENNYNDLVV